MRFTNFWTYRNILFSRRFLRTLRTSRANVLADTQGRPPVAGPYMAECDITYRCNCRCNMCQRWNDPRRESLTVTDYRRLAAEFQQMDVHQISIAGGEPLLRDDVFAIIDAFAQTGHSVNLCTNGMLLERLSAQVAQSGATCITVSLDGATAATHDTIRGVTGAYEVITRGIRRLLAYPRKKRPVLRVRMTVSHLNQRQVAAFYHQWHGVADDVLLQPVHHCGDAYYTGLDPAQRQVDPAVLHNQLRSTPLARDGYMQAFIDGLNTEGACPQRPCYAGVLMVRINPWGDVYPCLEQHVKVGSVRTATFRQVWRSADFDRERERLRTRRTCRCWYNNTALIGHYGEYLGKTSLAASRAAAPLTTIDALTDDPAQPCH